MATSYSLIANVALYDNISQISIAEDDVIFPQDIAHRIDVVERYLVSLDGKWDMFSVLIADLHPKTKIIAAEHFGGMQFVTIVKVVSMVFNIYNAATLEVLRSWTPENRDPKTNTIDRVIERQTNLRVVVALPFLVRHRNDVESTLWGSTNYAVQIARSEKMLTALLHQYQCGKGRDGTERNTKRFFRDTVFPGTM